MLNEEFGQGSYGKVSLVRHKVSGKQMVWKKTDFGGMSDKQKQQLLTEVHILMELKHENIVRCYDKFVDKKNKAIYLVMEALSGGDLSQLISGYRNSNEAAANEKSQRSTDCESDRREIKYIPEDFIWRIFTQIVLALYECHRRKDKQVILHRDLKPSNIFLDEQKKNAKLGDFGFAKRIAAHGTGRSFGDDEGEGQPSYAMTYLGSPYYMSPEQCNGQEYNEKSDIWSLGIIVYEMAQLTPPFMATN